LIEELGVVRMMEMTERWLRVVHAPVGPSVHRGTWETT